MEFTLFGSRIAGLTAVYFAMFMVTLVVLVAGLVVAEHTHLRNTVLTDDERKLARFNFWRFREYVIVGCMFGAFSALVCGGFDAPLHMSVGVALLAPLFQHLATPHYRWREQYRRETGRDY